MKTAHPFSLSVAACAALLISAIAWAQQPRTEPVALPERVPPTPVPAAPAQPAPALPPGSQIPPPAPADATPPAVPPPGVTPPALPPPAVVAPTAAPATAATMPTTAARPPMPVPKKGEILLNFQGAPLTEVLNYLSEAAGFVVVQETRVEGTVNVMSHQPISAAEAVDLLNAVLIEKGYVAIRNNRILKIVRRDGAQKRDLPVQTGSDPEQIPRNDEMVTQILPLRFGEAAKLVENLRPLLADNSTISANESSNSILLTDTQTNIRRIAQIIRAIDTSVAGISTIHVYPLQYANAKDLAAVVTQLFSTNTQSTSQQGGRRGGFGGFPGFGGGDRGQSQTPQSEAKQATSRIVAVADEQSNSMIVSAPADLIPDITEVVEKLDTSITDVTETRIFRLQHADATELAVIVTALYADTSQTNQSNNRGQGRGGFFGNQGQQPQASNQVTGRALLKTKVVAVGDPRTNSLIITAARESMMEIAETVGRLDSTDAKKQRVYVHSLEHADADSVATVLRGMLGDQSAVSQQQQSGANRLTNRSANGATMDTSDFSNSGGGGGGGARGGR